jgi:ferredoxin
MKGRFSMTTITADGITTFEADPSTRLVLALENAGIDILHRCGGNARCTTCRVEILDGNAGPMTNREQRRLKRATDATPATRLSCQVLVDQDLRLRVVNRLSESDLGDAGPRPEDTLDPDVPLIQPATE